MDSRIGLFGGSFDPIHFGHLISARSLAEQLGLDRVILVPAAQPPHKQHRQITPGPHRLAMAELAVEGDPLFEVSDVELRRQGPSYTFDTVSEMRTRLGTRASLFWFIGADSLPELPSWYRISELVDAVQIVTATRPGWEPPPLARLEAVVPPGAAAALLRNCFQTPAIDISATDLRNRVAKGLSIRYLTPEAVRGYIRDHLLYLDHSPENHGNQ